MRRRDILRSSAVLSAAIALDPGRMLWADAPSHLPTEIRIGYQKSSLLAIAKQQSLIEDRFRPHGVAVRWIEFPFGPPLMEALGGGRLDYGYAGNAPPIFAQAAGAPILYVAVQPIHGGNVGIVVASGSPARTLADLKGKRIAVAKGSSAHDLLVAALDDAKLSYDEIEPIYLAPADAASAFSTGAVDAWSIWDPFLAVAELARGARRLPIDQTVARQNAFFLANRAFATAYPHVVATLNELAATAALYAHAHHDAAARLFSAATGVSIEAETLAVSRTDFLVVPISDGVLRQQQAVADRFARIRLIPVAVRVADIAWTWQGPGATASVATRRTDLVRQAPP